jgi:hypothetical protein
MYGVVACGGMWRMPGGGSVTSWTERSGGYGGWPASSWVFDSGLVLVAAGLATALLVSMPVGSGPPRGRFALGYGLVLPHTLPLAGRRGFLGPVSEGGVLVGGVELRSASIIVAWSQARIRVSSTATGGACRLAW